MLVKGGPDSYVSNRGVWTQHERMKGLKLWRDNAFLPEASFRLLVLSLPVSVRPSVTKFGREITQHPFKLGSPNLDYRCKRPWLRSLFFGGDWLWPPTSNLTQKSKFTPFWACPRHNPSPVQARITKFWPWVQNSLVKMLRSLLF